MIKTRFCPSPTGSMHLGNTRTALFSALFAKGSKGAFLLRIEDTDSTRSEQKFTDWLQSDLHWLNLSWQEGPGIEGKNGPYFQSQRQTIYDNYYRQLEEMGQAYACFCTEQQLALNRKIQLSRGQPPRYPGTCRKLSQAEVNSRVENGEKPALRFHVPIDIKIEFVDLVRGQQVFESEDIGDFIIRRADGSSSFMFCNAIDDSLMGVTHALRGEDHLANTPRQLLILQTLKMRCPDYGHLSLILGEDGTMLSKRHGSFSLHDLREEGYLAIALLNYLARLSHSYDNSEFMTLTELAENFQLEKLSRAPARFDKHQLLHWQKESVMRLGEVWPWLGEEIKISVPTKSQDLFADVMKQNILFPSEAKKWADIFFGNNLEFTDSQVELLKAAGREFFMSALEASQNSHDIKVVLQEIKTRMNVSGKNLFLPVRIALTGEEHGPELAHIAALLGPETVSKRFLHIIEKF